MGLAPIVQMRTWGLGGCAWGRGGDPQSCSLAHKGPSVSRLERGHRGVWGKVQGCYMVNAEPPP